MLQDEQFRGGVGRGVAVLAQRCTKLVVKDGGFILTTCTAAESTHDCC